MLASGLNAELHFVNIFFILASVGYIFEVKFPETPIVVICHITNERNPINQNRRMNKLILTWNEDKKKLTSPKGIEPATSSSAFW